MGGGLYHGDWSIEWATSPLRFLHSTFTLTGANSIMVTSYVEGAYDMGQDTWGGENIEMSFRLWMCGGTLEIVPCSRISHVFRAQSPYTFKDRDPGKTIAHNLNRVAEVWMDDYAPIYYNLTGNKRHGFGDVSERKKFRREHNCKSFKWYVEEIAPYMFAPLPGGNDYHAAGQLQNIGDPSICIAPDSG